MKKNKLILLGSTVLALALAVTPVMAATAKKVAKSPVKAAVVKEVTVKVTLSSSSADKTINGVKLGSNVLVPSNETLTYFGGTATYNKKSNKTVVTYKGKSYTLKTYKATKTVDYVSVTELAKALGYKYDSAKLTLKNKGGIVKVDWTASVHNRDMQDVGVQGEAVVTSCARCHNAFVYANFKYLSNPVNDAVVVSNGALEVQIAFDKFATGDLIFLTDDTITSNSGAITNNSNFNCAVCHQSDRGSNALHTGTTPKLLNGMVIKGAGAGAVCMSCHEGRNKAANYDPTNAVVTKRASVAPHRATQTDFLIGTAGYKYAGAAYAVSSLGTPHAATVNACVGCHMTETADGVANHKMEVNAAVACGICHSGLTSLDRLAFGDYDGDKTIEPYKEEVEGLSQAVTNAIYAKIIADNNLATDTVISLGDVHGKARFFTQSIAGLTSQQIDDLKLVDGSTDITWNLGPNATNIYRAAYNVLIVENDGSGGLHNPVLAVKLLQASYKDLTGNDISTAIR